MKTVFKTVIASILIMAGICILTACGENSESSSPKSEYVPPSEDRTMTIEESGWTYDENNDCIYCAVIMKNNSKEYTCSQPIVKAVARDGKGKVMNKEKFALPQAGPKEKIAYGMQGIYSEEAPSEVTFKVVESENWIQAEESTIMEVIESGTRDYVDETQESEEDDTSGLDYEEEFGEIDDIFGEMDEDLQSEVDEEAKADSESYKEQQSVDREDLMGNAGSLEYYGKIVNDKKYDCSKVLVSILFRDGQGNLIGGENETVSDVKAESETPFSVVSSCRIPVATYEFSAYSW